MRNIYDIIAEQKAMVDVNIASYDLAGTTLNYIQEGFGEKVKKGAKQVVEFIKKILRKIKELCMKVFGFMKKKDEDIKKTAEEIKEKTGKSLPELLKSSEEKVTFAKLGPFEKRMDVVDNVLENSDDMLDELDVKNDAKATVSAKSTNEVDSILKQKYFGKDTGKPLMDALKEFLGDSNEQKTYVVKDIADYIYEYLVNAKGFGKAVREVHKESEDFFKKLAAQIEKMDRQSMIDQGAIAAESDDSIINQMANLAQRVANTISVILNYVLQSTGKAFGMLHAIVKRIGGAHLNGNYAPTNKNEHPGEE